MRKFILPVTLIALFAFNGKFTADNSTASVNQEQGFYIFTDSKPTLEYDYVGSVASNRTQLGTIIGGQGGFCTCYLTYGQLKANLIERAKKKKLVGDGLIINTSAGTADVIKFK